MREDETEMTNRKHLVFVYGTLKSGDRNNYLLKGSKFIQKDSIFGTLFDLGRFPALTDGHKKVYGEIWEISDETLRRLDRLEGVPHLYSRHQIQTSHGTIKKPWVYKMAVNSPLLQNAKQIPS